MPLPPLLYCKDEHEYRDHYKREYCRRKIITFDGIRVYFRPDKFDHVFYESSKRDGIKGTFSPVRAQRMDWIKSTLSHPKASLFVGWDKFTRTYDASRRVCVVYESFVVVIKLKITKKGRIKGDFVTCYLADNSIGKIRTSPIWTRKKCLADLTK